MHQYLYFFLCAISLDIWVSLYVINRSSKLSLFWNRVYFFLILTLSFTGSHRSSFEPAIASWGPHFLVELCNTLYEKWSASQKSCWLYNVTHLLSEGGRMQRQVWNWGVPHGEGALSRQSLVSVSLEQIFCPFSHLLGLSWCWGSDYQQLHLPPWALRLRQKVLRWPFLSLPCRLQTTN